MSKRYLHEIVQFVPEDKWGGCLGYISEIKECGDDTRYMVAVPVPGNDGDGGTAYRFSMESKREFECVDFVVDNVREVAYATPAFLPEHEL